MERQKNRYALLYLDRIKEIGRHTGTGIAPDYVYIQTTHNHDIEVVITQERSDVVLVFTLPLEKESQKHIPEYMLLVQMELFTV